MSRINILLALCLCLALPVLSQSIKPGPYDPGAARQSELNVKMNTDGSNAADPVTINNLTITNGITLGGVTETTWPAAADFSDYYTKAEINADFVATSTFDAAMNSAFDIIQANFVATSTYNADMGDISAALTAILGE